MGGPKIKAPAGYPGPCTQRVGGGRGLAARDAVCIGSNITVSGLIVQYFEADFFKYFWATLEC